MQSWFKNCCCFGWYNDANGDLIKPAKLMNIPSAGMLCSQKELNITGFNEQGIIELDSNTKIGSLFKLAYVNLK